MNNDIKRGGLGFLGKFISATVIVMSCMVMQSCHAQEADKPLPPEVKKQIGMKIPPTSVAKTQCGDKSLPPEVMALIGKKLPPRVVGMRQAKIPGFIGVNGGVLADSGKENASVLAYSEGLFEGKWTIFFMERIYNPDRAKEILDARLLPANLLDWKLEKGVPVGNSGQYRLARCRANKKDARIILGLIRPEHGKEDCAHFSRRIKQAWQMDMKSGCLISVDTQDLQCEYITMSSCY